MVVGPRRPGRGWQAAILEAAARGPTPAAAQVDTCLFRAQAVAPLPRGERSPLGDLRIHAAGVRLWSQGRGVLLGTRPRTPRPSSVLLLAGLRG